MLNKKEELIKLKKLIKNEISFNCNKEWHIHRFYVDKLNCYIDNILLSKLDIFNFKKIDSIDCIMVTDSLKKLENDDNYYEVMFEFRITSIKPIFNYVSFYKKLLIPVELSY